MPLPAATVVAMLTVVPCVPVRLLRSFRAQTPSDSRHPLSRMTSHRPLSIPQGYGKSTAARAFAADPANPHVIYVDLHGCDSFDTAARRVAEAIGYRTTYTKVEMRAKKGGAGIDDLDKPWGPKEYDALLRLFMRACGELKAAGKLKDGRPPMLLLDHASRPFGDSKRTPMLLDAPPPATVASSEPASRQNDTLIYQTLESTKVSELADNRNRQCRFVFITSDTSAERDSWESAYALPSMGIHVGGEHMRRVWSLLRVRGALSRRVECWCFRAVHAPVVVVVCNHQPDARSLSALALARLRPCRVWRARHLQLQDPARLHERGSNGATRAPPLLSPAP